MKKYITIRSLIDSDWQDLRAIRLEALETHRGLFLRSYAEEAAYDEARWKALINHENGKVFGLFEGGHMIGITGVFRDKDDVSGKTAKLSMSYIKAEYRRLGLSRLLYHARLEWAQAAGFERAAVSHRDGNEASRRANQAFGFKWVSSEAIDWVDGSRALDHRYELKLR